MRNSAEVKGKGAVPPTADPEGDAVNDTTPARAFESNIAADVGKLSENYPEKPDDHRFAQLDARITALATQHSHQFHQLDQKFTDMFTALMAHLPASPSAPTSSMPSTSLPHVAASPRLPTLMLSRLNLLQILC